MHIYNYYNCLIDIITNGFSVHHQIFTVSCALCLFCCFLSGRSFWINGFYFFQRFIGYGYYRCWDILCNMLCWMDICLAINLNSLPKKTTLPVSSIPTRGPWKQEDSQLWKEGEVFQIPYVAISELRDLGLLAAAISHMPSHTWRCGWLQRSNRKLDFLTDMRGTLLDFLDGTSVLQKLHYSKNQQQILLQVSFLASRIRCKRYFALTLVVGYVRNPTPFSLALL